MFYNDLFKPSTIALIGASNKKGKIGNSLYLNLLNSKVNVIPVNINTKRFGINKVYEKITDYSGKVDLAIIVIPANFVPSAIEDCGKKGIKSVIIISAGFGEVGNTELDEEVKRICAHYNIEVIGPNCLGVINTKNKLNATFFKGMPEFGNISFISQSGALGVAILDKAINENIGLSKFVSVGNMINTHFYEIIEYLNQDNDTKVICLYVEGLKKGKELLKVMNHVKKPVIVLKAGRTSSGAKAISSHTGSLAGSYKMYEGLFKQHNLLSVDNINELFTVAKLIQDYQKNKKNVLVVTNAGGAGVLASDAIESNNMNLVELPKNIHEFLNKKLPKTWSHNNPIDVLGDAMSDRYKQVLDLVNKKDFFDNLLCILTPQSNTEILLTAKALIEFKKKNKDKNVFACFMGGEKVKTSIELLEKNNIHNFSEPYDFGKIVGKLLN